MGKKAKNNDAYYQYPQVQPISDDIVNPFFNIAQDGSVQSSALNPGAAPNPFMQQLQQAQPNPFIQQQQAAQQPQQNYPVMDNEQRFDIAQPDTPNGYYEATGAPQGVALQKDPQQYPQNTEQTMPVQNQQYAQQAYQQQYPQNTEQTMPAQNQQYAQQAYQQQYPQNTEQTMPVQGNPLLPPFGPENNNG